MSTPSPHEPTRERLQDARGEPTPRRAPALDPARRPMAIADLQARRRRSLRKRKIARFDVALGVVVAATLLLVSPGLAITAVVALITLMVCLLSLGVGRGRRRLRARRRGRTATPGSSPGSSLSRRARSS